MNSRHECCMPDCGRSQTVLRSAIWVRSGAPSGCAVVARLQLSRRLEGTDMNEVNDLDITADIRELRRLVAAQSERIAELETHAATQTPPEERSTRRGVLRLAGAAVVGGAAASLLGAQPAAATTAACSTAWGRAPVPTRPRSVRLTPGTRSLPATPAPVLVCGARAQAAARGSSEE